MLHISQKVWLVGGKLHVEDRHKYFLLSKTLKMTPLRKPPCYLKLILLDILPFLTVYMSLFRILSSYFQEKRNIPNIANYT
jgi:hypothetical protein